VLAVEHTAARLIGHATSKFAKVLDLLARFRNHRFGGLCGEIDDKVKAFLAARSLVALPWKNEGTERFSMTNTLIRRERNALSHR
jgi:hypothetical protein